MAFSFTGLAYLLGFFALGLLSYRFFQYWCQEKNNKVAEIWFYLTSIFAIFMFITAVGGLFFAANAAILKITAVIAAFLQSFAFACIAYLIVYSKFPKFSPHLAFTVFLILGFISTISTAIIPFYPYLDESRGIIWDIQLIPSILRTALFLITFLPLIIILANQFKNSNDRGMKIRSLGIILILVFGILLALSDFLLENILKLPAISSAIFTGASSISAFMIIIFAQRSYLKN